MREDFLWGGASAACQIEGAYLEDSKGLTIADVITVGGQQTVREITDEVKEGIFYPSHEAIDFYHEYPQDLKLLAELGLKSYRFSISWARIYPNGDDEYPNEIGLRFYETIIDSLINYGIEPIITLSHLDTPLSLVKTYGSWINRDMIAYFLRFAKTVMERFKGKVTYWMTFNEVNHAIPKDAQSYALAYMFSGVDVRKYENQGQVVATYIYHMILATAKTVCLAHTIDPNMKVTIMSGMIPTYPFSCHPDDMMESMKHAEKDFFILDTLCRGSYPAYKRIAYEQEGIHLPIQEGDEFDLKNGCIDYIASSYYMSNVISSNANQMQMQNGGFSYGIDNPYLKQTSWGFRIDPVGLRYALNIVYQRYQIPIMIVENGVGQIDECIAGKIEDDDRIDFLKEHITQMKRAIELDGVDCIGYHVWTPIDLISGSSGEMTKRYGLVYVDLDNECKGSGKRIPKKSYYWYQEVIKSNGNDL